LTTSTKEKGEQNEKDSFYVMRFSGGWFRGHSFCREDEKSRRMP
jgi:hypothetical protein